MGNTYTHFHKPKIGSMPHEKEPFLSPFLKTALKHKISLVSQSYSHIYEKSGLEGTKLKGHLNGHMDMY